MRIKRFCNNALCVTAIPEKMNAQITNPSQRKKILFCEAGVHGGSVKRIINLLKNIDLEHFAPSVLSCFNVSKAGELFLLSDDIPSTTLGLTSFPAPDVLLGHGPLTLPTLFGLKYFIRSFQLLYSTRPDIVYLNNTPFCHLPMIVAAKLFNIKIICHMRDSIRLTKSELWALDIVSRIVVLSETHKDFYKQQGIPEKKMVVIYNGIDLLQFDEASRQQIDLPIKSKNIIAFIGILSGRKRQEDAILALKNVVADIPDATILFLGDGPDKEKLQLLARKNDLADNIIFTGMVSNVAAYLIKCKIGLMLSDREGMPNVILEYMASGLPVVTTDLPGVHEMVKDGETGFIISVGDVESIATNIRNLLFSNGEAHKIGKRGRKFLEAGSFTVQSELNSINQLLVDA